MTQAPEKWRLLLVDDEKDIRDVLTIALTDLGYVVLCAQNGHEALGLYREQRPPIVLTDIKMPGMDGIELLKSVKRENPDAEIIMITGHGDMELAIESLKHRATDFVTKPINVASLKIAMERVQEKILIRRKLVQYTERLEALVLEKIQLQDRLSSLGLMIGSISHAIKGLLTHLDAGLYLLESDLSKQVPEKSREGLDIVKSTTDHIKRLMLDILFYAKERQAQPKVVDIALFAEDIADTIEPKAAGKDVRLVRDFNEAPATFTLDPDLMRTALINILENAVDACAADPSKVSHQIRFRIVREESGLEMEIKDTGIGMKSETREKIFDLFFSSKGSKGTGFGLFIARNIVAQHGGTISVASTKGRGSIFIIQVPAPDVQGDNRHAPPGRELIVNPNVA
jgi:signal transduction histidine kinase